MERALVERFRGLTALQRDFPFRGIWQGRGRIYLDQVILMTALDFRLRGSAPFLKRLKASLCIDFQQEEVLITESALIIH